MFKMKTILLLTLLCAGAYAVRRIQVPLPKDAKPHHWIPRIVGGTDAKLGEFPFQVSLRHVENGRHTCGGSVISPRFVVTAAHCVTDNGVLYIVTGSVTLDEGGTRYDVEQVIRHEDYDPDNNWRNDIALLKTTEDIEIGGNVQQALLPSVNTPGDVKVNMSGWGLLHYGDADVPNHLQKLNDWPVYSNSDCSSDTGLDLYSGQICAGGISGLGVCNGDSGGPLSQDGAVIGLASFVFIPCGSGAQDVFTRVYSYLDWIATNTGEFAHTLKYLK